MSKVTPYKESNPQHDDDDDDGGGGDQLTGQSETSLLEIIQPLAGSSDVSK